MELVFQEKQLDYLGRVLDQTVTQELTAEVIVPDSCADADRVVDAFGTLLVRAEGVYRGKRVGQRGGAGGYFVRHRGRTARAAGDRDPVQRPARLGGGAERLPPAMRLPPVQRGCTARALAQAARGRRLLHADGLCRVHADAARLSGAGTDAAAPAQAPAASSAARPRRKELFSLNEEIEIPASKPPVERLLKCVYALDTAERKTIGNKAVFKGRLTVHILYESPDGSLQRQETELPFSQFAELEQDLDEGDLTVFLALTSAETEPDGQLDCRRLLLSAGILAQCTVCGEQPVELIEDAYCLDAELKPGGRRGKWRASSMSRRSARRRRRPGGNPPPP